MPKKIEDLSELKHKANTIDGLDCFIALNYSLRSSKHISCSGNGIYFYINNLIDGSFDVFTEKKLLESNIGKALKKGSLYAD